MSKCCGNPVGTPFCPLCGKKVRPACAVDELLAHIRITQKGQESQVENLDDDSPDWRRESATKAVEKWKRWGDALEEMIAAAQPKKES